MTSSGLWLGLAAAFLTAFGLGPLKTALKRWSVIDWPNNRSSHKHPTPLGAGWLLVPVALAGVAAASFLGGQSVPWSIIIGAIGLMAISGLDDVRPISPWPRLVCQAVAVAIVLLILPPDYRLFDALPLVMERLLIGLAWLWYINLFNFMDGLDGLSAIEILTVGAGVALIGALAGFVGTMALPDALTDCGLVLVGIACGFLIWNWHPARVFLGDVGSVPLGFLLGWVLLWLAFQGHLIEALLLSLFHVADTTSTLASRLIRRERVWRPHREHAYQQPVRAGWRHDRVVGIIAVVKVALVILAVAVAANLVPGIPSLVIAVLMVFGVIFGFHRTAPTETRPPPPALTDRTSQSISG